jgi:hypothetical protein
MIAYTWHTGKPGAKVKHKDPERDQIRRAAYLTFYVGRREPVEEKIKLAGLRWTLVENKRRGTRVTLVYRRIGKRPDDCGGGG